MEELNQPRLLSRYLEQYDFEHIFTCQNLPFRLYEYEQGELLSSFHDPSQYLKFLVSGVIQIYRLYEDGSSYSLGPSKGFTLLGDLEFCGEIPLSVQVEASTKVRCIELPIAEYREILLKDLQFLRFVMYSLAHKMAHSQANISFHKLEERFLHYLTFECENQQIAGVELAAFHLRCSRRQLQRVLKNLTEQGTIKKTGKGCYELG